MDPNIASRIQDYIDQQIEKAMPTLLEFLEIPSQSRSFDKDYISNGLLTKTAVLLKNWIESQNVKGLTVQLLQDEGFSPFIYAEVSGSDPNDETILFYGHMDKQPPFEGWNEGLHPYKPKMVGDRLYARGGADDGYSIFGSVLSIKALQELGLKHPRIVMLFEADEESGSAHIHHYFAKLKEQIGNVSLVICLDSGCGNYEQIWLTTTLRGNLLCTFTVNVLTEGVHSGDASGVVPSSFRILRQLLDRIEDSKTGEVHPDFQVIIPGERYKEAEQSYKFVDVSFPWISQDMKPVSENPFIQYLNRSWKAQLAVLGTDHIPLASTAGNVLRPKTSVRISIRLPPTLETQLAEKTIKKLLLDDVPYNATVTIDMMRIAPGWNCPPLNPFIKDYLNEASELFYQKPMICLNEGGSIPLMHTLSQVFPSTQFIITGVLGPESNAHGPNEFLHIPYMKKLVSSLSYFVARSYHKFSASG